VANVSVGASLYEQETDLAIADDGVMVAAWISVSPSTAPHFSIGYAYSSDFGGTWSQPQQVATAVGRGAGDPVLSVTAEGDFSLAWLEFADLKVAARPSNRVLEADYSRQNHRFGDALAVSANDAGIDKPWIVSYHGDRIVTYSDLTSERLVAAHVAPGGQLHPVQINSFTPTTPENLVFPCTDRAGSSLYAVYYDIAMRTLTLTSADPNSGTWSTLPALPVTGAAFQAPRCAARGSHVEVVYATSASNAPASAFQTASGTQVVLLRSADGGHTFGPPIVVSAGASGTRYLVPAVSITDAGALEVIYYESRGDQAALVRARSDDGGTRWQRFDLAMPGHYVDDRSSQSTFGDYVGLETRGGWLFATFADNTAGRSHISFARVQAP
jgi:hypothetical protein